MTWGARTLFRYSTGVPAGDVWDQAFNGSLATYSPDGKTADLTGQVAINNGSQRGTAGRSILDGNSYFEVTCELGSTLTYTDIYIGVCGGSVTNTNFTAGNFGINQFHASGAYGLDGSMVSYTGSFGVDGTALVNPVTIGVAVDFTNTTAFFYKNGVYARAVDYADAGLAVDADTVFPWAFIQRGRTGRTVKLATDVSEFKYAIPSGYKAWGRGKGKKQADGFNPAVSTAGSLSANFRTLTGPSSGLAGARTLLRKRQLNWYGEFVVQNPSQTQIIVGSGLSSIASATPSAYGSNNYLYNASGAVYKNGTLVNTYAPWQPGDRIGVRWNNQFLQAVFYKNGVAIASTNLTAPADLYLQAVAGPGETVTFQRQQQHPVADYSPWF